MNNDVFRGDEQVWFHEEYGIYLFQPYKHSEGGILTTPDEDWVQMQVGAKRLKTLGLTFIGRI